MAGTGGPVATFSVWDYVVFAGLVLAAAGIGLFQAIRGRKETSSAEFLLGGRQMTAVPVAMSLTASFMSGITVIGTPAEAYIYGTPFWLFSFSYAIMSTISAEIFVPLFYRLNITSTYEYLEMRFNKLIRVIGTSMYIIQTALYTGMVIYAPALALNQITGLDLWGVLVATGAVCIIYCTLGGLKAVIWTDVFQMVIMLSGFVAVIARGAVIQGGLGKIWEDSYKGGRLQTFEALYVNLLGLCTTVSLAMLSGLTMYSIYKDCDPLKNKDVKSSDQLLPYLVMDILAKYPGVPGLFVAAAYSGTLSTVSSSINALVAVTVEDFVKPVWPNLTEKQVSWLNMGMSVFFGGVCIAMAAIASLMGNVLQAALSIFGMISGPLLGVFLLGMFFRCANSNGTLVGLITGLIITLWAGIGAQLYPPLPIKTRPLPLSVAGCVSDVNITTTLATCNERPALANSWYSMSYLYFCPVGTLVTMTTGLIISAILGGCKQEKKRPELFIGKGDLICFGCRKDDENSESDLIEKVTPDHLHGLDNPYFTVLDQKPKETDKYTVTSF
ncbi:hypothetical protein NFI96_000541 [Prochilodus magdalenae]|nr:hypothetical protein NFI96_000541 [Prochilodus magdalenae]